MILSMRFPIVIAGLVACGSPPARPVISNAPVQAAREDPAMALPGDAVRLEFESDARVTDLVERLGYRCVRDLDELKGVYSATTPTDKSYIAIGSYDREAISACVLIGLRRHDVNFEIEPGDTQTRFVSKSVVVMRWREGYFTYGTETEHPVPSPDQLATWRTLRGGEEGVWSKEPFVQTLLGASTMTVVATQMELPAEWVRTFSGTIVFTYATRADAQAASERVLARSLGPLTDPALLEQTKHARMIVDGPILRVTINKATFNLETLLDQLSLR
jgi:hypothetical protein